MQTIVGVDPGKTGAIAILHPGLQVITHIIPLIGNELDLSALNVLLEYFTDEPNVHFFVEDVHAIFGSAAGATFNFGFVCGAIQMGVIGTRCPFTLIQPKTWQKVIYQGIPEIRKPVIQIKVGKRAGQSIPGRLDTKKMSEIAAKRLFPTVDLRATNRCKKSHDGIVDALLIAEYGRRFLKGE
jgi:hypothetical protein